MYHFHIEQLVPFPSFLLIDTKLNVKERTEAKSTCIYVVLVICTTDGSKETKKKKSELSYNTFSLKE